MRTIYLIAIFMFGLCFTFETKAQSFSEVGLGIGTYQYQGDLTSTFPALEEFSFAGSIFYRYNFDSRFAAKIQFGFGQISGDDLYAKNFNKRNTSFRSILGEVSLIGEVNLVALISKETELRKVTPFIFGGVSGFYFNPQGQYQGEWYDLQPLGTEGQGLPQYPDKQMYSLFQVSIPFGIDIRYNFDRKFFTGIELGMRKTFTDYLDDVSGTYADNGVIASARGEAAAFFADPSEGSKFPEGFKRGNADRMDWYSHFNVYFTYNFINKKDWRYMRKRAF